MVMMRMFFAVRTTSSGAIEIGDDQLGQLRRRDAGDRAARQDAVGDVGGDARRARLHQRGRGVAQGAARIDDVVDQHARAPGDVADDVHHLRFARVLAAFVDDRQRRVAQPLGERAGADDAADVGRDDGQVGLGQAGDDVGVHYGGGEQVVGRDVEEALDLPGVEIDRQHAVGTGLGDQVRHQLGRDRCPRPGLPVLPGIAEIGDDRRDPLGRGAPQRVDADQQLHQIVVRRRTGRLDNEDVLAADVLVDLDEDLLVGEAADAGLGQRQVEIGGDRRRKLGVRVPRQDFHGAPPLTLAVLAEPVTHRQHR